MSIVVGSVIEGTERPQDLIPKFMQLLQEYNPKLWAEWTTPSSPDYVPMPQNPGDGWWDSLDAIKAEHDLFDALDDLAPANCYFGAHAGNRTDFGFWPL